MQRIPSQADTRVLSSLLVESRRRSFGFCSSPVCLPFSGALERKLWDRDTEISNCLITSSSESEDVHSSSSSPKLLTGSNESHECPAGPTGIQRQAVRETEEHGRLAWIKQCQTGQKQFKAWLKHKFVSKSIKQEETAHEGNWKYMTKTQEKPLGQP